MVRQILSMAADLTEEPNALDLGAGKGLDALFLAERGFNVTAIERSRRLSDIIRSYQHPKMQIICGDIRDYGFLTGYGLIICSFALHFLQDEARDFLRRIHRGTNRKGVNLIKAILDVGEFGYHPGFLQREELLEIYKEWTIINYIERYKPIHEPTSGHKGMQLAAFMVAKKL